MRGLGQTGGPGWVPGLGGGHEGWRGHPALISAPTNLGIVPLQRAVARDLGSLQSESLKDGERPLGPEHPAVSVPETGVTRVGGGCFCILGAIIRAFVESG